MILLHMLHISVSPDCIIEVSCYFISSSYSLSYPLLNASKADYIYFYFILRIITSSVTLRNIYNLWKS